MYHIEVSTLKTIPVRVPIPSFMNTMSTMVVLFLQLTIPLPFPHVLSNDNLC
jgi:hypothetical protein